MVSKKRAIDANELLKYVGSKLGFMISKCELLQAIEMQPTVDAVEVVRCKDCTHYDFGVCLKIYSDGAVSQYAWQGRNPEDFCSYGERKANDDT